MKESQPSLQTPVPVSSLPQKFKTPALLAIIAVGTLMLFWAWVYFLNPAASSISNPRIEPPKGQDQSKSSSPAFQLRSSSDSFASQTALDKDKTHDFRKTKATAVKSKGILIPENRPTGSKQGEAGRKIMETEAAPYQGRQDHTMIEVTPGETLYSLIVRHYGKFNPTVVDCILQVNPAMQNIHEIQVNQKIIFPEINEDFLVMSSPEGSWKIYLGTFPSMEDVNFYKAEPSLKGRDIEVINRQVSPKENWYRILIGNFTSREEGLKAAQELRKRRVLPVLKMKD